jgi:hypothetical protein
MLLFLVNIMKKELNIGDTFSVKNGSDIIVMKVEMILDTIALCKSCCLRYKKAYHVDHILNAINNGTA